MQNYGINYVLNVSTTCPKPTHIQESHFHRIPVNDSYRDQLLPYFREAVDFIGGCYVILSVINFFCESVTDLYLIGMFLRIPTRRDLSRISLKYYIINAWLMRPALETEAAH